MICSYYICIAIMIFLVDFIDFFFFKQKTAYEMRISDWSSDVCSSDLSRRPPQSGTWRVELSEPQVSKSQNACRASLLGGPWRRVIPSAPIADDGAWLDRKSVV